MHNLFADGCIEIFLQIFTVLACFCKSHFYSLFESLKSFIDFFKLLISMIESRLHVL